MGFLRHLESARPLSLSRRRFTGATDSARLSPGLIPDYPLLLPAAIAHFWTVIGAREPGVPAVIGLVFTFSYGRTTVLVLDLLRGRTSALLGAYVPALALRSSSSWARRSTRMFLFRSSFWRPWRCLHFSMIDLANSAVRPQDYWRWRDWPPASRRGPRTKACSFCSPFCSRDVAKLRAQPSRPAERLDSADCSRARWRSRPSFVLIAFFKHVIAPPGDLFSTPATMLHKLEDPSRYWAVLKWYGKELVRFGEWWLIPVPIAHACLYFLMKSRHRAGRERDCPSFGRRPWF